MERLREGDALRGHRAARRTLSAGAQAAWKLWVDFGPHGVRKTSAQVKAIYCADELVGRQIVGVINFPPKQVGPFVSEFLLTGFHTDEGVVITTVERPVPNGARMA
jgi:tRNA-binding protein